MCCVWPAAQMTDDWSYYMSFCSRRANTHSPQHHLTQQPNNLQWHFITSAVTLALPPYVSSAHNHDLSLINNTRRWRLIGNNAILTRGSSPNCLVCTALLKGLQSNRERERGRERPNECLSYVTWATELGCRTTVCLQWSYTRSICFFYWFFVVIFKPSGKNVCYWVLIHAWRL